MRNTLILLLTLGACFVLQGVALRAVGGRTTKSESNYFSSLGRIQAGAVGSPEVMMLGSSITGRLPDRTNGFSGFANMGCDGGSAVDALRAMDRKFLPFAPVLVIEANTLVRAMDPVPSEVGRTLDRPWFQAGIRMPLISAYARPAAFLYSFLLSRKIGDFGDPGTIEGLGVTSSPGKIDSTISPQLTAAEKNLISELSPLLQRLQKKECRIVFVWMPPGRPPNSAPPAWIMDLISKSGCEWWDLGNDAPPGLVTLTDGVHMSAASAASTVISLEIGLEASRNH